MDIISLAFLCILVLLAVICILLNKLLTVLSAFSLAATSFYYAMLTGEQIPNIQKEEENYEDD